MITQLARSLILTILVLGASAVQAQTQPTGAAAPEQSAEAPAASAATATAASPAPAAESSTPPAPTEPQLVAVDKISAGDTAWMLTSTALVLMMTIPGLALLDRKSVV